MLTIEVKRGGKTVYKGKWFSLEDAVKEPLPQVLAEPLIKILTIKE